MKEIKFRAWVNEKLEYDIIWPYIEDVQLQEFFNDERFKLMQYTGLKDKQGKEIYEGDIVELQEKHWSLSWGPVEVVSFENGCFYPWGIGDWEYPSEAYLVIGNIYENPELMKSQLPSIRPRI